MWESTDVDTPPESPLMPSSQRIFDTDPEDLIVFNDPIHGHIELDPICVKVIDTPQFQRLRRLKQLGGAYYVFPGASHNRFEHSIGVCHLAGEVVESIRSRQPYLGITPIDALCVKLAGLCHDLGHGPFSHTFDGIFIPAIVPDSKWKHEHASVMMFDYLISDNPEVWDAMQERGMTERDLIFIKEQIAGPLPSAASVQATPSKLEPQTPRDANETIKPPHASDEHGPWPYEGRAVDKSFLYEIVANKRNGIDVDKWDYFSRDCHALGIATSFDYKRFIKFVKVLQSVDDDRLQICARDKEVSSLYDMFHTRNSLHRRAYQHKTCRIIEYMITEVLVAANEHITIPGVHGPCKMSEAIHDPKAFMLLTDDVFTTIQASTLPDLQTARGMIDNILHRRLYKCVDQTQPDLKMRQPFGKKDHVFIGREVFNLMNELNLNHAGLELDDIFVDIARLDFGMGSENPIDRVRFYEKGKSNIAQRIRKTQVSQMLPETFAEQHVRIYCKKRDESSVYCVRKAFRKWCALQHCTTPKGNADDPELTPSGTPFVTPVKGSPGFVAKRAKK